MDEASVKLIGIEEHLLTPEIRAAWASSAEGEKAAARFARKE